MKCLTKKSSGLLAIDYFHKKLHLRYLIGFEYTTGLLKLTSRGSKIGDTQEVQYMPNTWPGRFRGDRGMRGNFPFFPKQNTHILL